MKNPLHKKVDKLVKQCRTPWEVHPYATISITNLNWLRDTVIRLEKENIKLRSELNGTRN